MWVLMRIVMVIMMMVMVIMRMVMVIMMMGARCTSLHLQAGRCFLSFDLLPAIGAAAGDYLEWVDCSISDAYFPPTKMRFIPVSFIKILLL